MISSDNIHLALQIIPKELLNTLYMVGISGFFALLIGLPLGVILALTERGGLQSNRPVYSFLSLIINIGRSIPFAILIIALFPLTRWITGTTIGTTASIVPLTLAAAPLMARLVEAAFKEIDRAIIEAALVMGSTKLQLIYKIFFPEALPSLINGGTIMFINLVGYSAMAGLVGGGGLGKVAIQYGYQRFNGFLMIITLILLLLLIEIIQWIGNRLSKIILIKRGQR